MKRLIVSADDFGMAESVNQAVEVAHRDGLLSTASLMVAGKAAADAVERARANPALKIGLHLVLVEGDSVLSQKDIPLLVDSHNRFPRNQAALGFRYFFRPGIRAELEREIRAQFVAFAVTGLELDHVNAHKHMHLHPTVARLMLAIAREHGCRAVRLPRALKPAGFGGYALAGWTNYLGAQARHHGMITNDYVCGLAETGHFDEAAFLACLAALPEGVTEAYFHPAMRRDPALAETMPGYDHQGELAALLSVRARAAVAQNGIRLTTWSELARA